MMLKSVLKKMSYQFIYVLVMIVLLVMQMPIVSADNAGVFLHKSISGRASGMGMAMTSVVDDANAVFWNPAALSRVQSTDIVLLSSRAFETDNYSFLAAFPLGDISLGAGYFFSGVDGILGAERVESRALLTGDRLSYTGNALFLSASTLTPFKGLSIGSTVKWLEEKAASRNADAVGVDVGFLYEIMPQWRIALQAQNLLQPELQWNTPDRTKERLPQQYRFGTDVRLLDDTLTLAVDLNSRENRDTSIHLGAEYWVIPQAAFRVGIDDSLLTIGSGIHFGNFRVNLGWMMRVEDELDDTYRLSLGLRL